MATYRGVEIDLTPTDAMAEVAERALEWREEFGRGGTEVGVARARDISNKKELSADTVRRMVSFFARHEVDKEAEGFNRGEDGFPSAGRVAWDLWGGDPGKTWAGSKDKRLDEIDSQKGISDMATKELKKTMVVDFEMKAHDEDDRFYTFEGYASTYGNIDRGNDRIVQGAFDNTLSKFNDKNRLPILWQHKHYEPLGVFTEIRSDDRGLFVKGRMPKDDSFVRDRVMPQMRTGSISKMSIGFMINDLEFDGDVRVLKEIDLWEVSLVTIPMNNSADVTNFKSAVPFQDLPLASRDIEWDSDAAIERVREFTGSEDEPKAPYRRAFLWFDSDEPEEFGSYKLPIADVIDGRLTAVPRGVFAAAAALRGARGGVDIPQEDRQRVINNIVRYYDKMGLESPFSEESSFRIDDIQPFTVRELEKMLNVGVSFSRKDAKKLASILQGTLQRDVDEESRRDDESKAAIDLIDRTLIALKVQK